MKTVVFKRKHVSEQDILRAMQIFDQERRHFFPQNRWRTYAVLHDGERYPPKEILSIASGVPVNDFVGGHSTNRCFQNLGFQVSSKDKLAAIRVLHRENKAQVSHSISREAPSDPISGQVIYVGDSSDVVNRIRTQHCSGNVEGSALRRHVAKAKEYCITLTKRASGSTRQRLDMPDPREGEKEITQYLRSGRWKYIICPSQEEARDFQWYTIERLDPTLNVNRERWNPTHVTRYEMLFSKLEQAKTLTYDQLKGVPSGPGVYVLYHDRQPG